MSTYALVEDGKVVKNCSLPNSWKNISGLDLASDTELKEFGWFPYNVTDVILDDYEVFDGSVVTIGENSVSCVLKKRAMTSDEKKAQVAKEALYYKADRKTKYDLLNQFDLQYEDKINSTDTWGEAIEAIKKAHPKP